MFSTVKANSKFRLPSKDIRRKARHNTTQVQINLQDPTQKQLRDKKVLFKDLEKAKVVLPARLEESGKEATDFILSQGHLNKFNWSNQKKVTVERFFQVFCDRIELFNSLYGHGLRNAKPLEKIYFKQIRKVKGLKEFVEGFSRTRLFIYIETESKLNDFENFLQTLNGDWLRIVEVVFKKDADKEFFLEEYYKEVVRTKQ